MTRITSILALVLLSHAIAGAQGMISAGRKAAPRTRFSGRPWPVSFVDVAAESGLGMTFTSGDERSKKYVIEANGTGVAFLDYNNDGRLDIFLVNGSRREGLPPGKPPSSHLYRNDGSGKFTDVTEQAGANYSGWGNGVCAGDYDNDGFLDLYVTYWGHNILAHNKGGSKFENVAAQAGVAGTGRDWSTGCSFIDYDRDGHLDLVVATYLEFSFERTLLPGQFPFCSWKGAPVYCGPRGLPSGKISLFHNRGDGTFEDVSVKSGLAALTGFYGFTVVAADLNGDGWIDLYVACDSTPSMLLRNQKNGTFTEIGTESGLAYNENGSEQAGMGLSVGDFNNDGLLDVLKTNFIGDYPNLYRNAGKGFFTDVALKAGLAVNPDNVLWGTGFADLDNDGWKDIVQVSGHVYPEVARIDPRDAYEKPRLVYRNLGNGRFEDVSSLSGPGIAAEFSSRGCAFGDFDNDGDTDVVVMNMHQRPSLLRNDEKSTNRWVKFRLEGTKSNRAALGAVVEIQAGGTTQADTVLSQSSFLSHNDLRLHFGLGSAERVEQIVVRWPSGLIEQFPDVDANSLYLLLEGSGQARRQELPK